MVLFYISLYGYVYVMFYNAFCFDSSVIVCVNDLSAIKVTYIFVTFSIAFVSIGICSSILS